MSKKQMAETGQGAVLPIAGKFNVVRAETVIHGRPFRGVRYTTIPNAFIADKRLTAAGLGVLVHLHLCGNKPQTVTALAERFNCSPETARKAFRELIDAEYMELRLAGRVRCWFLKGEAA